MKMKYRAALVVAVCLVLAASWASSPAFAASNNPASAVSPKSVDAAESAIARVNCRVGDSHTWSHLGGDPVWQGGVHSNSQLGTVVKSASGQRALICIGLNQAERGAVTAQISNAKACTMRWGQSFIAMSFHSDGASVDRPTSFVDPRFKAGAKAFCLTIKVKEGSSIVTINLLWPEICVNAALVSVNSFTPAKPRCKCIKPKPHPKPAPKPPGVVVSGNCNTVVVGNNNNVTSYNCNTWTVWVQCGNVWFSFADQTSYGAYTKAVTWQQANCNSGQVFPPTQCTSNCNIPPGCQVNCVPCQSNCQPPPGCQVNCVPQVCTGTPEECFPKNGTLGPGIGTPGQPGGAGAGGVPGTPMCRNTAGDLVPGTPDSSGNCPGATPPTTGTPASPGPSPPPSGSCIDPVTLQPRPGTPDQFGYCT